jgi:SPP1 gp7 family putative phage head morphogenesis protein
MPRTTSVVRGFLLNYPVDVESIYESSLLKLVNKLKLSATKSLVENKIFVRSYNRSVRQDDVVNDFEQAIKLIEKSASSSIIALIHWLPEGFEKVRSFTKRNIKRSITHIESASSNVQIVLRSTITKTPNISVLRKMWVLENTKLIKSIPTEFLSKIGEAVYSAVNRGESISSLSRNIENIYNVTARRAKIIARDQISKLKAALNRYESLNRGVVHYEWSTTKDDAVRASHKIMNGKMCSWLDVDTYKDNLHDTRWKKRSSIGGVLKHPGEDILCRCTNILVTNVRGAT